MRTPPKNKNEYLNKIFGKLTILNFVEPPEYTKSKNKQYYHWVSCSCNCNNSIKTYRLNNLIHGITKSCGCAKYITGKDSPFFTGHGEISGKLFSYIKRTASGGTNKRKRICKDFKISIEYMWKLFLDQNRLCAISGVPIKFSKVSNGSDRTASLDRINSDLGYVEGNVQWVHKTINMMKNVLPVKDFYQWCKLVSDKNNH